MLVLACAVGLALILVASYGICKFLSGLKNSAPVMLSHEELRQLAMNPHLAQTLDKMVALHEHLSTGECTDCMLRFLAWQKIEAALGSIRDQWKHTGRKDMRKLKAQGFVPNHGSWDMKSRSQFHLIVCPHCREEYLRL